MSDEGRFEGKGRQRCDRADGYYADVSHDSGYWPQRSICHCTYLPKTLDVQASSWTATFPIKWSACWTDQNQPTLTFNGSAIVAGIPGQIYEIFPLASFSWSPRYTRGYGVFLD